MNERNTRNIDFDQQHIWHPYSAPPSAELNNNILIKSAEGVFLHLADGHKVIDGMSSWWSALHGYNHPHINQAIKQQVDQLSHVMFGGLTHDPAIELGKQLLHITPNSLEHIFYSDSGSVSVEVALKMAVQYQIALDENTQKYQFLSLRSGYHGDTWSAMSVSDTGMHDVFKGSLRTEYFTTQPPVKFNQIWNSDPKKNGLQSLADILEQHAHQIAALILEPVVQNAGGLHFYHPEYLNSCRALCDQHDVLLIFDEIATGFGRSGKLFATEYCQIQPDILCLGKALTGGYLSLAATLCSAKVADAIGDGEPGIFMHGPTFMGNPLACSAAIANIELLATNEWQTQVNNIEQQLKTQLQAAINITNVIDVRVIGAIGVIEMNRPVSSLMAQRLCSKLGVWLRPFANNIYCMPPFVIDAEQLTQVCDAMLTLAKNVSET